MCRKKTANYSNSQPCRFDRSIYHWHAIITWAHRIDTDSHIDDCHRYFAVIISQGASTVLFAIHPIFFFDKFNNACLKYFKHTLNMLSLAVTQPLTFMSFGCVPIIPQKEKSFQFEIQTQNQMNCFFNSPNELKAPHREQFIFDRVESIGVSKVVQLNF